MIDRLIPRYRLFLILGFVVVASCLFVLTAAEDVLIVLWANKLFDGDTGTTFRAAQTADKVISHTLKTLLFVGLSLIKLGIGFAIATIVLNLRSTGQSTIDAYSAAGVAGAEASRFEEPWIGRHFTRFLFGGMLIVLSMFVLTLWWDANLVFLKQAEFDGNTSGAAYETYLMIERILGPLIGAGKFLGEGVLIFGIVGGLAAIVTHLSFQARSLPSLTRSALGGGDGVQPAEPARPAIPHTLINVGIAALAAMVVVVLLAFVRAGFIGWALGRQFAGSVSETALTVEGILGRTIDPLTNLALGLLFFAIAFLLMAIIQWLREFRRAFGDVTADSSQGAIPRPTVESNLWPERVIPPLAIFGLLVVIFFFFTMTAVHSFNFGTMLTLQFAGATDGVQFENAQRLDRMLVPIIEATRFMGLASLMLAIGLALVTIVVNLRATGLLLPMGFSKLIPAARGERPEVDDLSLQEPMLLAPWRMLRPLLAGLALMVSATLPIAIVHAVSIHRMLAEQYSGLGDQGVMSGLFRSSFLSVNLLEASRVPWMLFGMALVLFSIGRFFTTIVTFVQTRRMIIVEGTSAISEAVSTGRST
ncbi:MAG: hypothetical protein IH862_04435 [Chloroflexi bacterium]|nr:hypothetical protein [Chloroflexota bacterium]